VALKRTNREVVGVSVVALDGRIVLGEESKLCAKNKGCSPKAKENRAQHGTTSPSSTAAGLGTLVAAHTARRVRALQLRLSISAAISGSAANSPSY